MADVSARIAVRRRPRNLADRAGEEIREDAFRLDDAAVAEARLARRLRQTVDERHRPRPRLKRERRRNANNSSAKNDYVDRIRGHGKGVFFTGRASRGNGAPCSILDFRSYRPRSQRNKQKASSPMIPRYSRPEMTAVWSSETRFRIWFEIEAYASEAMAEIGVIPKAAAKTIWEKGRQAKFDVARVDEIGGRR